METQKLSIEADSRWSSLPFDLQQDISRLVHSALMEGSMSWDGRGVAINLTSSDSDYFSIASMKRLLQAVGSPLVRVVNGENYFDICGELVSVVTDSSVFHADKNQLVLF